MGVYIADPSARVMPDGKMYIYGSLDVSTDYYCSDHYHVLSTDDAIDWTLHPDSFAWEEILYAPDGIYKDGKYLLYFDVPCGKEYVAESDSPCGPFGNAVQIEGPEQIDPCIFIDDDGAPYYYWGQFSAKGAKMTSDFRALEPGTSLDGIVDEEHHNFHEGSFVFKRGEYYYYTYADIGRNGRPTCIGYAMSDSPFGPYEYKGVIIDNAGCDPAVWNNHGSVVCFNGQWYVLYHRATHNSVTMRKACIEPITFNEDGTINEVEMTSQGAGPSLDAFSQIDAARVCWRSGNCRIQLMEDRTDREELACILEGDTAVWKYIDFGRGAGSVEMRFRTDYPVTLAVSTDSPDSEPAGKVEINPADGWQTIKFSVNRIKGIHSLWIKCIKGADGENSEGLALDYVKFLRR